MNDIELEKWKEDCHRQMDAWKNEQTWQMHLSNATGIAGQAAMKSALLINGGAAVAILAFIGQIFNSSVNCDIVHSLKLSMILFVSGTLSSAVAFGTTYLAQLSWQSNKNRFGLIINNISTALVILSYLLFLCGSYTAWSTF